MTEENLKLKKKLKSHRIWLFITIPFALFGCFVAGVIGVSIFSEMILSQKVNLSEKTDTIAKFAEDMPMPEKIKIAEREECQYYFVTGSGRRFLASGPPVYVFDRQGSLIMSVGDTGDVSENHPWWKYYNKAKRVKDVSLQEAVLSTTKLSQ